MEIISRKEALNLGLKYYFTGKPCKHGHVSKRDSRGSCYECKLDHDRKSKRHLRPSRVAYQKSYFSTYEQKNKSECQARYSENNKDKELARSKAKRASNKHYYAQKCAERRIKKVSATPSWFEKEKVSNIYKMAKALNLEVDHVVPIKSDHVCGLHCWDNLQLLSRQENAKKGNYYWPHMEFES